MKRNSASGWITSFRCFHSTDRQHRGNVGEGQLHVRDDNIRDFDSFEARSDSLATAVRSAYERQVKEE